MFSCFQIALDRLEGYKVLDIVSNTKLQQCRVGRKNLTEAPGENNLREVVLYTCLDYMSVKDQANLRSMVSRTREVVLCFYSASTRIHLKF